MKQLHHAALAVGLAALISLTAGCARQRVGGEATPQGPETPPISAQPQWYGCEVDSDCKLVEGLCRSQTAINQRFEDDFLTYRDKMNPTLACEVQEGPQTPAEVGCVQKRCTVKPEQVTRPGGP